MAGRHDIIFCDLCWANKRRLKTFSRIKHLNIHLAQKHQAKFRYGIAGDATHRVLRPKRRKLKKQSILIDRE